LNADDYHGLYAIIPTPALAGSEHWGATATLDLDETARVVDRLIQDGADGIIALGTTGECPTLSSREYEKLVHCLADTVASRVPLFVGATAMGLHDVVGKLEILRAAGVDGTLLGLPMWQPLTEHMALNFYGDVAEAFPALNVMVYANERAFRFPFRAATDFWRELTTRAPTVTSAKFSRPDTVATLREVTDGRINFLPSDMVADQFAALPGATTACWATAASMGPWPAKALIDAIVAGDEAETKRVAEDLRWANAPLDSMLSDQTLFASYNIQVEKLRIDTAGYCHAGPIRPPYAHVPDDITAAAVDCGRRWAVLCERYRPVVTGSA
jgi:dihydrodipicolinate synthase/N-acetylneuraminate lyase